MGSSTVSVFVVVAYVLLGLAVALGWLVWKRRGKMKTATESRPRRHAYGLSRELEVAGKRVHVRGRQEPTRLGTWHVEVAGPFPDGLALEPRGAPASDGVTAIAGLERWSPSGSAEVVAATFDAPTRAALAALRTPFALRDGKLVGALEVPGPDGLREPPADALALAKVLLSAPRGLARLGVAAAEPDPVLRALALEALVSGHRATPECEAALAAGVDDRDARVRVRALFALGRRGEARTAWQACDDGRGGEVQAALHGIVRKHLGDEAMAPLWREAIAPASWSGSALRRWLASAIGVRNAEVVAALGGPDAAEDRLCALLDDAPDVADAALTALDRVGTVRAVQRLQAVRARLGRERVGGVLLRLQARLGKGGELALSSTAEAGALSEVE